MCNRKVIVVIFVLAIVFGVVAFSLYRKYSKSPYSENVKPLGKGLDQSDAKKIFSDSQEDNNDRKYLQEGDNLEGVDIDSICVNAQWVNVSNDRSGSLSKTGKLRQIYPDDPLANELTGFNYYLEADVKTAVSGPFRDNLDYFVDRFVELKGTDGGKIGDIQIIEPQQIRCSGKEVDKDLIDRRKKILKSISEEVNSLSPVKPPYKTWVLEYVEFIDDNNLYVYYYDSVEDDENQDIEEDTQRKLLVEVSNSRDKINLTRKAYWEPGEEDYILKSGSDPFKDVSEDDLESYSFDVETNDWIRD